MRRPLQLLALPPLVWAVAVEAAPEPGLHSFTLENGLTAVVIEDRRAPVVTQMVWYKVGSAEDPAGQTGTAHFLEHLMFKSTDDLSDGEFSRIVAENGGSDNAFTSTDYTAYYQRIAADRLALVMGMEADRMVDLAPTMAGALSERDVVLEERKEVVENEPTSRFHERLRAALYGEHPYGRPVIGWENEIAQLTLPSALDFYRAHYAPDNAVLVVAGDVDAENVRLLAEKHFGPIPASTARAPRAMAQEPRRGGARRIEMRDARVSDPVLWRYYLAPQRRAGDQSDAAALAVLASMLGGSLVTSVMGRELVLGDGPALDAGAGYSDTGLDAQIFSLHLMPRPGVGPAEAEAALDAVIERFVQEGPDASQLARVKKEIRADEIYLLDYPSSRARRVGEALTSGLTLEDVAVWPDLLQEVTAADVQAAAEAVFSIEDSVTGWLTPEDAEPREAVR